MYSFKLKLYMRLFLEKLTKSLMLSKSYIILCEIKEK